MWKDQRVNCVLCAILLCVLCYCFTVSTLLCMAVMCTTMQSNVQEVTGRRTVLFSPPSEIRLEMQNH
ncbi:unnamed protein product, partial [Staurois parvus]